MFSFVCIHYYLFDYPCKFPIETFRIVCMQFLEVRAMDIEMKCTPFGVSFWVITFSFFISNKNWTEHKKFAPNNAISDGVPTTKRENWNSSINYQKRITEKIKLPIKFRIICFYDIFLWNLWFSFDVLWMLQ